MTLGAAQVQLIVWCKKCQHQVEPDRWVAPVILLGTDFGDDRTQLEEIRKIGTDRTCTLVKRD
jgi:hypothetical protein